MRHICMSILKNLANDKYINDSKFVIEKNLAMYFI